jgi:hypothetical protein
MKKFILVLFSILTALGVSAQKKKDALGYDKIYPYKNSAGGRIAKVEKNGKQGYIKDDGTEHVPCVYDNIFPWEKGVAKVQIGKKYGFIKEEDGEEFIPVKYEYIGTFKNGLAVISNGGRRGLINEEGEEIVPID